MTDFSVEISDAQVARFREDGFVTVERITTDEELEWLGGIWDELFVAENRNRFGGWYEASRPFGDEGTPSLTQLLFPEVKVPALRDTALVRNARHVAARLMDVPEDELGHWGHFIAKAAGGGHATPWHQDEAYWEPDLEYRAIGSWVPLSDVDVDDGCLWFVPGSHRLPVLEHRHVGDDPAVQLLETDADVSTAVPVPLPAGGCSFHHPRTLHHSRPNISERERRAVANEFQTTPVPRATRANRPWHEEGRAALEAWAASVATAP